MAFDSAKLRKTNEAITVQEWFAHAEGNVGALVSKKLADTRVLSELKKLSNKTPTQTPERRVDFLPPGRLPGNIVIFTYKESQLSGHTHAEAALAPDDVSVACAACVGPVCPATPADPRSVTGSANRVGAVSPPGQAGSAGIGILMQFPFAEVLNLAAATVTIVSLLDEVAGAGELVKGTDGLDLFPLTLTARPGSRPNGAIFETPPRATPKLRLEIQRKDDGPYDFLLRVERAAIPGFPQVCEGSSRLTTPLLTHFAVDDGVNPVVVRTVEAWRCVDLIGRDPLKPRSLRVP